MLKLILVFLFSLISLELVQCECIYLEECPAALKYINNRRHDPETIEVLQKAHCTVVNRRAKVDCNKVLDFEVIKDCVYYHECPKMENLEKIKDSDPFIAEILSAATCGYNGRKDMIKCSKLSTAQRSVNHSKHKLLPSADQCGIQTSFKISGGQKAELEDFPWLVLLKNRNRYNETRYSCMGTLISKRYVLTAAHCLQLERNTSAYRDKIGNLSEIILGEYNTEETQDCLQGYCADPIQVFKPESIHVHPKFKSAGALSDIALIRLDRDVNITDFVKPICLPLRSIALRESEFFMIGGWGRTENKSSSSIKLKARVFYMNKEECLKYQLQLDDTQICAGSTNGTDTCKGDSGGPLMVYRKEDREFRNFVVGIVSYGGKCGSGKGVYTNVSSFIDWILETIHE